MEETFNQENERLCKELGVRWEKADVSLVNETIESITKKYKEDEHLNNVPLRLWDALAPRILSIQLKSGYILSLGDAVCVQKYACIQMIKRNNIQKRIGT